MSGIPFMKRSFGTALLMGVLMLMACNEETELSSGIDEESNDSGDSLGVISDNDFIKTPLDSTLYLVDARDSSVYRTINVGEHRWMARNLNYAADSLNSSCYEYTEENCDKFGRLYDLASALKACPEGWHLPSNEEWADITELQIDVGDPTGFAALRGGFALSGSLFAFLGEAGFWWTSTGSGDRNGIIRKLEEGKTALDVTYYFHTDLLSVRCLQDD